MISSREGSTNWSTRRILTSWLNQITSALNSDSNYSDPNSNPIPIPKLTILTGLLQGLQSVKATRKKNNGLGLNVNYHIRLVEDEWLVAFAECLEAVQIIYDGVERENNQREDEWESEFKKIALKNQDQEGQDSQSGVAQARGDSE